MTDVAIVLAAGKGTRMRSQRPKVLHELAGRSMLDRVLGTLAGAGFPCPLAVVGYAAGMVQSRMGNRCTYVHQTAMLGTGDAMRVAMDVVSDDTDRVLLVHGDEPLIPAAALQQMLDRQRETGAFVVLLTTHVSDTRGFGRLLRDSEGNPTALVQEADLGPDQRHVDEVNLGAYVFDARWLRDQLRALEPHAPKGEYYLTDVVRPAAAARRVSAITIPGGPEVMGVNDLIQLEQSAQALYRRTNCDLMEQGVTIVDSASTFIDDTVTIEEDTVIHPFSMVSGVTSIGRGCQIGPHASIFSSHIGRRCRVLASTLEEAQLGDDVTVGPYAHLRPGAVIGAGAEIGNYAEIKRSFVGPGTRVHHFSYLGDAHVGADVNIGAGTVTCNYDGREKHRTIVGDHAFIGSDTMLRAPVTVGEGAFTGAGSVVTHDVAPGALVAGVPARLVREGPASSDPQPSSAITERET